MSTYLKILIPAFGNEDNEHVVRQENYFFRLFNYHNWQIQLDGDRINVNNEYEDPLYETTFELQTCEDFHQKLLHTIRTYVDWQKKIDCQKRCSVVLNHQLLFEKQLTCTLRDVPTRQLLFGNIHNNEFYNHWQIFFGLNADRQKADFENRRIHYGEKLHTMTANFEFDKTAPVIVDFYLLERKKRLKEKTPVPVVANFRVNIEGESIRRIIVNPSLPSSLNSGPVTRLYFVTKAPVTVKRSYLDEQKSSMFFERVLEVWWGSDQKECSGEKVLTENQVICIELEVGLDLVHTIISRLRLRWNIPIEFSCLSDYQWLKTPAWLKGDPCALDGQIFRDFLARAFPKPPTPPRGVRNKAGDRNNERKFAYTYLIKALLSRGSVVKDQLLLSEEAWQAFLWIIAKHVNDDEEHNLCESALEDLLNHVDSKPLVGNLLKVFSNLCDARNRSRESNELTKREWDEGYRKIRKAILTPTKQVLMAPEIIMSNRAVNGGDHDGTRIIRVNFRDDSFQPMRRTDMSAKLMKSKFAAHLENGFCILGRVFGYLASSNSQMRENGAYFMEKYSVNDCIEFKNKHNMDPPSSFKPKIIKYRQKLGNFEEAGSIPKAMARLGQCFTQARACNGVEIGVQDYRMMPDVIGGRDLNGSPFMYTDGIGMISKRLATSIAREMKLSNEYTPSAYQVRFRGLKGMLVVDPRIDETADFFEKMYRRGLMKSTGDVQADLAPWTVKCLFRPSQLKFRSSAAGKTSWPIELVKQSAPSGVTLNRPFISVLDHVSAFQSHECHTRVCRRIEELLDVQLDGFAKCIVNEEKCRSRLEEMPRRVKFAVLERKLGFTLSSEPFFKSLIKASVESSMLKLLNKMQIQIPSDLGRTMYGVTDETGELQYGQVFARYTENVSHKVPANKTSIILKGRVMITKFPTTSKGDVRMFEAVDIPALRHLENVVVFSQYGPRSQPDEMAGSDLDGDEYAIVWDPLLFLDKNEEAFAYTSDKPPGAFSADNMDKKMHDFFIEYMEQDNVGHISVNHLYQSDQYGIDSDVCNNLAKKYSMALDYLKSGVAPAPLTNRWKFNEASKSEEPPERSERQPDFASCQFRASFQPMYSSSRLLGTLFRELRAISDVVVASTDQKSDIELDPLLICPGSKRYEVDAEKQMKLYNGKLRSIMDQFGINTEAEIFSGCYRQIRNRRSEKEQDDMSMFNTETIIENQMTNLYRTFREKFFDEFVPSEQDYPAYMRCTESEDQRRSDEETDVLRRVCKTPTIEMMAKAVAYYQVCYKSATDSRLQLLSFAWLAYDILNAVRSKVLLTQPDVATIKEIPLFETLRNHRIMFLEERKKEMESYNKLLMNCSFVEEQEQHAANIIYEYMRHYRGLKACLFVIDSWAKVHGLIHNRDDKSPNSATGKRLKWYHLALMVIMVATRQLGFLIDERGRNTGVAICEIIGSSESAKRLSDVDIDRLTLSFFRALSTREFRTMRSLNFAPLGVSSVFLRGEWLPFHTSAINTYYNLLLNMRFGELPVSSDKRVDNERAYREGMPFIIELPAGIKADSIIRYLKKNSKCVDINGRIDSNRDGCDRMLISCSGTVQAISDLRDFASVKLPRYQWQHKQSLANEVSQLCYFKITGKRFSKRNVPDVAIRNTKISTNNNRRVVNPHRIRRDRVYPT